MPFQLRFENAYRENKGTSKASAHYFSCTEAVLPTFEVTTGHWSHDNFGYSALA